MPVGIGCPLTWGEVMKAWAITSLLLFGFQASAVDVIEKEGQKLVLISQEAADTTWELFQNRDLSAKEKEEAFLVAMAKEAEVKGEGDSFCEVAATVYGAKEKREDSLLKRCPKALLARDMSEQLFIEDAPYTDAKMLRETLSMYIALLILL